MTRNSSIVCMLAMAAIFCVPAHGQFEITGVARPMGAPSGIPMESAQPEVVTTGNGIEYFGGAVMPGPHNVYFIWYGNWSGNNATTILPDLIRGFSGSLYFNTNTTYGDIVSNVANSVTLAGQVFDNYSQGTALNLTSITNVVGNQLAAGTFPTDNNGIYFVLSSPDVTETDFCVAVCGFHGHGTFNAVDIKAAFIGDSATQCPHTHNPTCSAQTLSPNGNEGADAMANTIAHELNETVTDPDLNAWFHINTAGEVGDLCNFKFGPTFTALSGGQANVVLAGRQFLLQQNWINANGGGCGMGFSAQTPTGLRFVPVTPCRIADTRNPAGAFGGPFVAANSTRGFTVPNSVCNIPLTAQAYSVNATVVPHGTLGFLTAFPCGQPLPLASTLNATDGRTKAAAAIVPAGPGGNLCFFATNDTELVLDINGYFVPNTDPTALAFFPVAPCRLVDTRLATGALGGPSLTGNAARVFPILSSPCSLPAAAQAYSLNFTSVPKTSLGFLTTWPAGQTQPLVSTLNAPTGTVTANAAIVPGGANGDVSVFVTDSSDLVIDVNGYFAPPAAGGLSLFGLTPCRVLDTRNTPGLLPLTGPIDVNFTLSGCGAPATAQSYVVNATVVPPASLGFVTLWPQGSAQPLVSTLNAMDGAITSNLAIVPTSTGAISSFASNPTHLILDISGYFAP